jgi:hypothetical protein
MSESKREAKSEGGESKAALLAEAYKRGILPDDMKTAYEEAMRRGLVEGVAKPTDVAGEVGAVGAGGVRGVANIAGLPVDAVNAGLNLLGIGTAKPVGGSEWWKDRAGNVVDVGNRVAGIEGDGRAVIDAQAQTTLGRLASRAAEEVGSAAVPMAGAMRLGAGAVRAVPSVRGAVLDSVGGVGTGDRAAQLVASAGAGLGAGIAQEAAPNSQVAEFIGGLLGGGVTLGGLAAGGQARNFVAPLMSPGARQDAAGNTLRQFATNADALRGAPSEIVPGSALTTAQAAADPGLASLERTLRSQQATGPIFAMRDAERAAAQRGAVQALAPEGGGAEAVQEMVRGRVGEFQQRTGQRIATAQGAVDQRVGALGPGLDPVAAGAAIRREIGDSTVEVDGERTPYGARAVAKASEKNLWDRLEQNEDLALEVGAGREAALRIVGKMTPSTQPLSGDAAGVIEAARNLGDVVPWRELQDLRSWANATGQKLRREGDAVNASRMEAVVRGLDADVARAVGDDAPGAGPTPNGGGDTSPPGGGIPRSGGPAPAAPSAVYTPAGQRIETGWRLVDLAGPDAPVPSHTADFRVNPAYRQELQPRARDRATSEAQVVEIAGKLDPDRLGHGGVNDGAPIVGPDNMIESGNGRTLAIARAYRNGGEPAQRYRAWLEGQGFDTAGMKQPALVRVRTNELSDADRVRYVQDAAGGQGMRLSPVEQARVDGGRLSDDALSLYRGGSVDDPANIDLAREFVRQSAPGDANALATADGRLSVEGVRRIQGALLHKTFGDDTGLVSALLETGDDNIKALGRALTDAAPKLAQLRAAIARGDVPPEMDPVPALLDSVRVVQRARTDGAPIGDVLGQADAFNPIDNNAAAFLSAAYGDNFRRVSVGRTKAALDAYVDEAMQSGGLFGGRTTAADAWGAARRRAGGIGDDAPPAAGAGSGGDIPPGGGGAVPPGGAGGGSGGGGSVVGDGLTPNFGPDDAAQYRAARAATAERKQTFDRGAPGQVLQQGGYNARGEAGYAMPVEQVAARFFNAGKSSRTDMAEFMRAAEGRAAAVEALRDYAIGDLRRAAVDDAGRVDPKRWAAWVAKHDAPLKAFPEVRGEFANVAAAQRTVDRLTARRDQAVTDFGRSGAGKFLDGRDADAAFASVINSGNRTQGLTQLVRMAKGDADKLGQLRRATVDHLIKTVENTGSVDALGNQSLSPAKTVRFMSTNGKALQKSGLLSPGQIAVLRRVEEDMNRAVYVQTVGKAVGSPTYQNFAAGAVLGQLAMGRARHNGLLANTIGRAGNWIFKIADRDVQKLVADAMLDPSLARDLMARATPDRMQWVVGMLKRRAVATGLITGATADGE